MSSRPRRFISLVLVMGMFGSMVPIAVSAAAPTEASLAAAEASVLGGINVERTKRGLIGLRLDTRLAALARERAVYMAENDLLSHTHAGGQAVWDMMSAGGIAWYGAGEIIAYNTTGSLTGSASTAVTSWMNSAPHKAIAMSKDYNYMAFGVAVSTVTGRRYWAGVFLKGPDRTGVWTRITSVTKSPMNSATSHIVIRWAGDDARLQVLTSGFRYFNIQTRVDGGAWSDNGTRTNTSVGRDWLRGRVYEFRIRGQDKAGNWGRFQTVTITP